jgi:hypothetical protein
MPDALEGLDQVQVAFVGSELFSRVDDATAKRISAGLVVSAQWGLRGEQVPITATSVLTALFMYVVGAHIRFGCPLVLPAASIAECMRDPERCVPFSDCGECGLPVPRAVTRCPECGGLTGQGRYALRRARHARSN